MTGTSLMRWLILLIAAGTTLLITTGCDIGQLTLGALDLESYDASETLTRSLPYSGQRIVIDSVIGMILIEGQADPGYVAVRPVVRLEAVKKVRGLDIEDVRVIIEQDEQEIRIRTEAPAQMGRSLELLPPRVVDRIGWVEFTLRVPPGVSLDIDQNVGEIRLIGLKGELRASTQVGRISVEDSTLTSLRLESNAGGLSVKDSAAETLELGTQVGGISVANVAFTTARLTSQTGGIAVSQIRGRELTASTQVGGIAVADVHLEKLRLSTQLGGVALADPEVASAKVSTQVGGITVRLSRTASLRVKAETQMGAVRLHGENVSEPELNVQRTESWPGEKLTLRLGAGEGRLTVSTETGGIEIILED